MAHRFNMKAAGGAAPASSTVTGRENHPDSRTVEEVAVYIGQMTAEMATMARASDMKLLAYFLDMARLEANVTARKVISHPR
jgi:hypothetical protein